MSGRFSVQIEGRAAGAEPMPKRVAPMLAVLSGMPGSPREWGFEYKWDGVRALCYWDGSRMRLESRNRLDISGTYPELAALAGNLAGHIAVLDGEIIAVGPGGRPDFGLLQRRQGLRRSLPPRQVEVPISFMLFDLLYLDGRLLMPLPFRERRRLLEGLELAGAAWKTPPSNAGEGQAMLRAARENGLEGVMAKRLDSPYQPGRRSADWLKIKIVQGQEFIVGGWIPLKGDVRRGVGALLLGYYEDSQEEAAGQRRLVYAGKVGTGFKDEERVMLRRRLAELGRPAAAFEDTPDLPRAFFVEPRLVVEIEYRGWTLAQRLRQPSYKGIRTDKDPAEVVREAPA